MNSASYLCVVYPRFFEAEIVRDLSELRAVVKM